MKKYRILVDVPRASGSRIYEIQANSRKEALLAYNAGKGKCVDETLEADEVDAPTLADVEECS